jgi:membrane fusion protein (multidrug efflux system)
MKKQILIGIGAVFGIMVLLGLIKFIQVRSAMAQFANYAPPAQSVTSIIAKEEVWQESLTAVGSISPVQGVILSPEEPGNVTAIYVESGSKVNKDDLLLELDTSVEEGNLKAAKAREVLAEKNLERMQSLRGTLAISKNDMDTSQSKYDESRGEVLSLEGLINKKKIRAPFAGTLGIRSVNVGQHLEAGNPMFPLFSLDKMYVDFWLPQQAIAKIHMDAAVDFTVDVFPEDKFTAKISAVNPQIDSETRNIKVQAIADNSSGKLRPGMYVKVDVKLPETNNYVAIPSSSINFAPYGNSVFIIEKLKDPKGKEYLGVRQQIVEVGKRRGEQIAIIKGIKNGEEVVTSGVFKLRPGIAVSVNNAFAPQNEINSNPPNT